MKYVNKYGMYIILVICLVLTGMYFYIKVSLDIEKENGMTVASALRTIPPRQDNKADALLEALSDD